MPDARAPGLPGPRDRWRHAWSRAAPCGETPSDDSTSRSPHPTQSQPARSASPDSHGHRVNRHETTRQSQARVTMTRSRNMRTWGTYTGFGRRPFEESNSLASLQPWPACHGPPRARHRTCTHAGSLPCRRRTEPNWELGRLNHHALPCSMLRDPPNLSPTPGPCRERLRATEKSLSISTLTPTPNPQTPTPNPNPNAALIQALIGRPCHLGWSAMFAGMRAYSGLRPMTTYIGVKVPISPPATSPSCACRSISRTLPEPLGAMPTNSMKLSTMFIMKVPQ